MDDDFATILNINAFARIDHPAPLKVAEIVAFVFCCDGTDAAGGVRFRVRETGSEDLEIELDFRKEMRLRVNTLDAAGVTWYRSIAVDETGARPYERNAAPKSPTAERTSGSCSRPLAGAETAIAAEVFAAPNGFRL